MADIKFSTEEGDSMSYQTLLYEVSDHVLTITLNRPDRLNAFTGAMMNELIAAFDAADADDDVRAIIVTGAGRAFCAGADLSEGTKTFDFAARADRPDKQGTPQRPDGGIDYSHESVRDGGGRVSLRIFDCMKPVIAAINGPAVGVGATTLRTRPPSSASCAENTRPVMVHSSAWLMPTTRGRNQLEHASGVMPRRAKTKPKRASVEAMRISIGSSMVAPTPTAGPLMAAITGFIDSKMRSDTRPPPSRTDSWL
jgi:hypothetical protein